MSRELAWTEMSSLFASYLGYTSIFQLIYNVSCLISPGMVLQRGLKAVDLMEKQKNHGSKSPC